MYTKLNRKITENLFLSYLIALIIGCFAFTPILFLNITQLDALTDQPLILGLITISSISMKFISGLGISLMFSMVCYFPNVFNGMYSWISAIFKLDQRE
jgi:hypothetical protein